MIFSTFIKRQMTWLERRQLNQARWQAEAERKLIEANEARARGDLQAESVATRQMNDAIRMAREVYS